MVIDDGDKMEPTNWLDTDWGPGNFFDASLLSFDVDQGIKSSCNKWRTRLMLSELCVGVLSYTEVCHLTNSEKITHPLTDWPNKACGKLGVANSTKKVLISHDFT